MSVQYYPNGIGGTAPGDSLDLARPLQTTGNIWYVSSLVGTDAASPAGQNREKPLATVAQAVTNAVDDDIIVFLPGHTQTLTALQTIAKRLTLIGEGTTSGKPAVSFLNNSAAAGMFNVTADACEFRNLYFPPNLQTNSTSRVSWAGTNGAIRGCYFECGATDTGAGLSINNSGFALESSTFISVATLTSAQPGIAIRAFNVGTIIGLAMRNVVVSAGTVGFSNYAAVDFTFATAVTQIKIEGMSLLLGADMAVGATSTGRINVQLSTGGSRVSWG